VVAACENFGLEKASNWPKNALANPNVTVQIGASVKQFRARLATDEEAARNMPRLVDIWPAHDTYRERSGQRYVFVFERQG
jgi:deazaflavin-dependent oxidoreductase (nitroreductase family)